jgi:hypothetical protein
VRYPWQSIRPARRHIRSRAAAVAADVVKETSFAWNILLGRSGFDRLVRDQVFLPIMRWPAMQRWWVATGSQLRVNYRRGPWRMHPSRSEYSALCGALR